MGRVRFTSILSTRWLPNTIDELDEGVLDMATDIHRASVMMAPKVERHLVNSGVIERVKLGHYRVKFGGINAPYAKRRHFENFKNPGTLLYLQTPGDQIARSGLRKYLRRI